MGIGFISLVLIGFVLVFAFTHVLEELAIERESGSRRRQKRVRPLSDDTIVHSGHS